MMSSPSITYIIYFVTVSVSQVKTSKHVAQLIEELLSDYNKGVRPVKNVSDALVVKFGANLCRLLDVDEVNQVLTTSLWLELQWSDSKLTWNPDEWGNVKRIHIPSDQIWIPDVVLYNNVDGEPHISVVSQAMIDYQGTVIWMPPSIYKSLCQIDIANFPYDIQECALKFGGWSHDGELVDLQQLPPRIDDVIETRFDADGNEFQFIELGMGLSFYHESAEWDLLSATSSRHVQVYAGCCGQPKYIDITYNIVIRRKALFFTVIIVIPCMLIANLTIFVFCIPPREHKMSFATSVLVALTFYYVVLIELVPPTSLVIPLIGRYLLFTLLMVFASIFISILNINIYRRQGSFSVMPSWMRWLFVKTLPRFLALKMITSIDECCDQSLIVNSVSRNASSTTSSDVKEGGSSTSYEDRRKISQSVFARRRLLSLVEVEDVHHRLLSPPKTVHAKIIHDMAANVAVIAATFKANEMESIITDEWRLMSLVIDRIFAWIYLILNLVSILLFIFKSQALFDTRLPLVRSVAQKPLSGDAISMLHT
ncbi:hypothetical protein AB6A40_000521 [Gnathostoma spinigerum]|uniref:Uncharacterized protein n=1 Tax=Gnathostoma spinigerum TaxID=75299 RepID=A0ABD6E4C3_9BILA